RARRVARVGAPLAWTRRRDSRSRYASRRGRSPARRTAGPDPVQPVDRADRSVAGRPSPRPARAGADRPRPRPRSRAGHGHRPDVRRRVLLLGGLDPARWASYAAVADVFVAPNRGGESFGMILVEAMAAGVPVVASDIPGFDEVVSDGVDGILVPPGEPPALAAAAGRVLENPDLAERLAGAGREKASSFSWTRVADRIGAISG